MTDAHPSGARGGDTPGALRLVAFPALDPDWIPDLLACAPGLEIINAESEAQALGSMPGAVAFYGRLTPALLAASDRLRWVQASGAGLEHYIFPELAQSEVVLTNMAGIYGDALADHAMAMVLSLARNLHRYARHQLARRWERISQALYLPDLTMGIIGLGGIGAELAKRASAFGMRLVAVDPRRTQAPQSVSQLWRPSDLGRLLETSDFVVICAPHTPETQGMMRLPQFRQMKPSAYLINVGRGAIVSLDDLTTALQQGLIAGAGLDVFEVEPLPESHPLWDMDNVIIVPHAGGAGAPTHGRRRRVLVENLRRFALGEPLENVVDKAAWY